MSAPLDTGSFGATPNGAASASAGSVGADSPGSDSAGSDSAGANWADVDPAGSDSVAAARAGGASGGRGRVAGGRRPARSFLFVPADQRSKVGKAGDRGAEAVILDLEDGVAPSAKEAARNGARELLDAMAATAESVEGASHAASRDSNGCEWWVRINGSPPWRDADLDAVVRPGLRGIAVPKVDSEVLRELDELLGALEARVGLMPGSVAVLPLIETARGLLEVGAIAASPRVERLTLGEVDLAADLGIERGAMGAEPSGPLRLAQGMVVIASAAAGLDAPLAAVSTNFADLDAFRADCTRCRGDGFWGRAAIHPAQLAVIDEVFRVGEDELARARRVVEAYREALGTGRGAVIGEDGTMLDEAVVAVARRTLRRAGAARTGGGPL